ncbi:hypothetical protein B0A50_02003 [Salinomyces thailandicus]|uniref:Uncharacterized protein n=1 Tax=Salinomyces thailandicus TaxID=706561 RepID=A0A4U0U9T8_9PEZI|nr:hypothetical protein B0A50_02003 [Salinomyces thailandica]
MVVTAVCPLPDCTDRVRRHPKRRTYVITHLRKDHGVQLAPGHGGDEAKRRRIHAEQFGAWLAENGYDVELNSFFRDIKDGITGRGILRVRSVEVEKARSISEPSYKTDRSLDETDDGGGDPTSSVQTRTPERSSRALLSMPPSAAGKAISTVNGSNKASDDKASDVDPACQRTNDSKTTIASPPGSSISGSLLHKPRAGDDHKLANRRWRVQYTIYTAHEAEPRYTGARDLTCIRCRPDYDRPDGPFTRPFPSVRRLAEHYSREHGLSCEMRIKYGQTMRGSQVAKIELWEE